MIRAASRCLGYTLALCFGACGPGSSGPTADAARGTFDVAPGTPDAAPGPPDAMPTPYGCLGKPLPTTAPATITISGTTVAISGTSTTPLSGVAVAAFVGSSSTPATSTTSNGSGDYSVSLSTGGSPLDDYLRARYSGDLDMYLYPAVPMTKDGPNATLVLATQTDLNYLALSGNTSQSSSKGFLTLIVVDCLGNAVSGAKVTVSPSSGATIRYLAGGQPSDTATSTDSAGTALVFDAPVGTVTVGATISGMTLRAHAIDSRAGAITATVVQP